MQIQSAQMYLNCKYKYFESILNAFVTRGVEQIKT